MDQEFKDSVMIALVPAPEQFDLIPNAHLTLVYAGKVEEAPPRSTLLGCVLLMGATHKVLTVPTTGRENLGPGGAVDTITYQTTPELYSLRKMVEHWNASEYEDFLPHLTLGPAGAQFISLPIATRFDRIWLSYGSYDAMIRLKGGVL